MSESEIQKSILDYLKLRGCIVFKHNIFGKVRGQVYRNTLGVSDIIGCTKDGRFLAIEVKKPGGKTTSDQLRFLDSVRKNGGIGILAFSLDEVMKII